MTTKATALLFVLAVVTRGTADAQTLSVTPNPVPLDGSITIQMTGVVPNGLVSMWWDQPNPGSIRDPPNVLFAGSGPHADANGNVSYTLDLLTLRVYPASVGTHTLTAQFFVPFNPNNPVASLELVLAQTQVTITPRSGWPVAPPIGATASSHVIGGLLAYLDYSADHMTTSVVLNDGTSTKTWGTFPTGSVVGRPEWSPDGSQLAIAATIDTGPDSNLFVLDRAGHTTQITALNGTPPKLTGGGTGSVAGTALPYLGQTMYNSLPPGDPNENCGMLLNTTTNPPTAVPQFPNIIYVNLVGTKFSAAVARPAGSTEEAWPFRFDNVPEGDYWVHMSYTGDVCQETTKINPLAGANDPTGAQPATLLSHDMKLVIANISVPVHVTAGQVAQIQPERLTVIYQLASSAAWLDAGTILFSQYTTDIDNGGVLQDVWSVQPGMAPVQLTNTLAANPVAYGNLDVSPVTKRLVAEAVSRNGLLLADSADIPDTHTAVTSPAAISAAGGPIVIDSAPAWSPDGSYIAFVRTIFSLSTPFPGANAVTTGTLGDLYVMDVATGDEGHLAHFTTGGEGVFARPAWSPDESQIAVSYTPDDFKTVNIRVFNIADASFFDLTTDGRSARPSWTGSGTLADAPNGVMLGVPTPAGGTAPVVSGDLNGDGKVSVADAVVALRIAVGLQTATPAQLQAGDLHHDGRITISDVTQILRIAVGLG